MADVLLEIDALRKEFGGLVAVNNVDFEIPSGAIVSLIGPNGAGKTTFFNMITGFYVPTTGEISFDGRSIVSMKGKKVTAKKPHEVTALGIGRTFQNIRLFGTMSALDNVRVGHNVHLKSHWWDSVFRSPGMLREEQASIAECISAGIRVRMIQIQLRKHQSAVWHFEMRVRFSVPEIAGVLEFHLAHCFERIHIPIRERQG